MAQIKKSVLLPEMPREWQRFELLIISGRDRFIGNSLKLFPDLFKLKPLTDS
jgi:hypothetical protein